jgi:hypothetical protein
MNTFKKINYFAIGLPLISLLTYPAFGGGAVIFSLLSTMLTGFIQLILAILLLIEQPYHTHLRKYMISTVAFFSVLYLNLEVWNIDLLGSILVICPIILAIYLTIIIHKLV